MLYSTNLTNSYPNAAGTNGNHPLWKLRSCERNHVAGPLSRITRINKRLHNDSTMNLNPMEINDIYEAVWNVGVVLQSDEALSMFDLDYRPWAKVKEGTEAFTEFYRVHDRNKQVQI